MGESEERGEEKGDFPNRMHSALGFPHIHYVRFHSHLPRRILVMQMYKFCGCTLERLGLRGERERDVAAVRSPAVFLSAAAPHSQTPQLSDVEKNESNVSFLLLSNERTK